MKNSHNQDSGRSIKVSKSIGMTLLSLFVIVMIIPSVIVWGKGDTQLRGYLSNVFQEQSSVKKPLITLGWVAGNINAMQSLTDYKNLSIVSPALASIDNQSNLQLALDDTSNLQNQGKRIWARLIMQNDTNTSVNAFLANPVKMAEAIKKINQAALSNHWDGINIDIENVSAADRDAFSQFMKKLSKELNQSKIKLSIDLPPDPKGVNKNAPFDHKLLGEYCDYIVFMGYDQHWSTDPVPGPVTSLSWLKENLQEFIQTGIPSEKIILGLPAYTRVWQQNHQGQIVKDPAQPIEYVENQLKQNHQNLTWDASLGEYYTSYSVDNLQYKIWLPTEKSFSIYLDLVPQYHLAGTAVWNLNQIQADYWNQTYGKFSNQADSSS